MKLDIVFGVGSHLAHSMAQALAFVALFLPTSADPWTRDVAQGRSPVVLNATGASVGCQKPAAAAGKHERWAEDGEGRARRYVVVVPETYDGHRPMSLIFGFHGRGASAEDALSWGVASAGLPDGTAIFVAPEGRQIGFSGKGWDSACGGSDIPLFDNIVADLSEDYCVNTRSISVYGFSWGGNFATSLACCRGDRLAAVAIHAATSDFAKPQDPSTYRNLRSGTCPAKSVAAIRFTHAEKEDDFYKAPLFASTSKLLRKLNRCSDVTKSTLDGQELVYTNCAAPIEERSYPGLGHAIPPNWGPETWSFIARQRGPAKK